MTRTLKRNSPRPEVKEVFKFNSEESTKDPKEILQAHEDTFRSLYSKRDHDPEQLQALLDLWVPPSVDLSFLGKKITKKEVQAAIDTSKNRKSPGPDGLPIEVYKCFNKFCVKALTKSFNQIANSGFMPNGWKEGRIILLHKKGSRRDILNYRPITLLNADYKLLCKILAKRLNKVIKDIIPSHQIGFMPRRILYDNIITLDYALNKGTQAVVLDFAKAYDSISHEALLSILDHLNFPQTFKNTVKALLHGSNAKVLVNQKLTNPFPILRGVKQGDPLSPLLFSLVVEPLQHWAKHPLLSRSIPLLNNTPISCLMYADDTVLLSKDSLGVKLWMKGLQVLEEATGLTINKTKTFLLNSPIAVDGVKPSEKPFRYLGFNFEKSGLIDDWNEEIKKAIQRCKSQAALCDTITTKMSVLKSYILSTLWFKGFLIGKPSAELDKSIKEFLWNTGSRTQVRVSAQRALRPKKWGGLGLWDFDIRYTALKAKLALRMIQDDEMKAHQIFKDTLERRKLTELLDSEEGFDTGSRVADSLLNALQKILPVEGESTFETQSIARSVIDLQEILMHKKKIDTLMLTKRQKSFRRHGFVPEVLFTQVNRLANIDLRHFLWQYFQGALPFKHGADCTKCWNGKLSHVHIFFECKDPEAVRLRKEADTIIDLIFNQNLIPKPTARTSIHWNEQLLWREWSQSKPVGQAIREVMAITLWAIWKQSKERCTVYQLLATHLNDELALTHLIRDHKERNDRTKELHRRWRTRFYWTAHPLLPYCHLNPKKRFTNPPQPQQDTPENQTEEITPQIPIDYPFDFPELS